MITCSECTRRDLCQALKRDRLCNSYCWIHILLLKTLTSMPHYGNSWPSVCSPKASVGNLIEKASVRASDYRAAQLSARPVGPLVQPPPPPLRPLFSATASPLLPRHVPASDGCWAGALCGLRSTKRISVWTKLSQAIENTVCVIAESWFGSRRGDETNSRISVLNESLEASQDK